MKQRIAGWLQDLFGVTELHAEILSLQEKNLNERLVAEQRYNDLAARAESLSLQSQVGRLQSLERETAIGDGVRRLEELVTPRAARLHGKAAPTTDWDEIQRTNLRQFEEPNV